MATPSIYVSDEKLRRKMKQYELLCGKEVKQLVHNAGRVCCVELASRTFPLTKDPGDSRVGKDISKIFMALNQNWFEQVVKSRAGKKHNSGRVSMFDGKQPLVRNFEEAKAFHKANRVFRRGKELPLDSKAIVQQKVRDRLVKYIQSKVGMGKAGWAVAALMCKADVRSPMRGIPQWVTKQVKRNGVVGTVNDTKASGLGWKISMTNHIGYVSDILKPYYKDMALQIARGKFFKMMSHAIRYEKAKEAGLA